MQLEQLIGNYQSFFSNILNRLKKMGISISGMPLSHLLYRVATVSEYVVLREQIKQLCSEFVETQFNGRAVSILILQEPLILEDGFQVSMIELPAPRPAHTYPTGLESIGIVVGKHLAEFNAQYRSILTGIKDHGEHCQRSFITFENDKTAKFYDISLREIVRRQGWTTIVIEDIPNIS
ncbi:MAG: VOC family protein [Legionella sp.]|jgi:predicted metalloenzyme YecM